MDSEKIEKISEKINKEISSGYFQLQIVIDRNLASIESMRNADIQLSKCYQLLKLKKNNGDLIKLPHFRDLYYRAVKKPPFWKVTV